MASIRQATAEDLISIQTANLLSLPENYQMKYYYFHILSWPELSWVAEDAQGRIVGYVLGKLDDDDDKLDVGHITSLAVFRTYRRLGLAEMLMRQTQKRMITIYNCKWCDLHVRESNYAARHLYEDVLHFHLEDVDVKYYADGENGLHMRRDLHEVIEQEHIIVKEFTQKEEEEGHHCHCHDPHCQEKQQSNSNAETQSEPKDKENDKQSSDLIAEDHNQENDSKSKPKNKKSKKHSKK
ncbi:hypothetical protein WA158_001678 [Blastocystis sp. Blastoise]